jgi:hypothetical protein
MKKLLPVSGAFFFASVVFTSCGPSACDCAELTIDAIKDVSKGLTEKELEDKYPDWKKCEEATKDDKEFEKEMQDCMNDLITEGRLEE